MKKSILRILNLAVTAALVCAECTYENNNFGDNGENDGGGTVKIGDQTWMAKNLDRVTKNSKCYNNSADSCAKYGRLYNWTDAKTACPSGWHLPSSDEWAQLTDFVGGSSTAGTKLKSSTGWRRSSGVPAGRDNYKFSALPGGYGYGGNFNSAGVGGMWWGITGGGATASLGMRYDEEGAYQYLGGSDDDGSQHSVRCVQD